MSQEGRKDSGASQGSGKVDNSKVETTAEPPVEPTAEPTAEPTEEPAQELQEVEAPEDESNINPRESKADADATGQEAADQASKGESEGEEDNEESDLRSIEASAPAPTPQFDEGFDGEPHPMDTNDLESALDAALSHLESMSTVEFLQTIANNADIHEQAVMSAKSIAKEFVSKAADLAEAMQLILLYDQLMLKKLNLTTAYDFGVKPKTDDETRAVMIDRAQRMLQLGQRQYDISHQISESAKPLIDYRFEACDDFNAVQEKIANMREEEKKRAVRLAQEEAEALAQKAAQDEAQQAEGEGEASAPPNADAAPEQPSAEAANPTPGE
ncbi:unnamed protein product [Mesocestoides corti]|uniref:DUF5740 domain-containing protein n=1 Tax=Mesocestoides corti TaxID=53468 RepID=A0A0R3UF40_MESCO|nr:unnamed protein product [Mesocestoides corti]